MKLIPLSQGKFAQVDNEDFEWLNQWKWHYANGYAERKIPGTNKRQKTILMHREIIKTPEGMDTDHIDHNRLNNQRYNLRICTTAQNSYNQSKQQNNISGYKGVSWHKRSNKWRTAIRIGNNIKLEIGYFDNILDAAKAYDIAAKQYHGKFAYLNFKEE